MENRPLTYVSQKDVFKFLPLETRRKIAKRYPESRRYHRKLPLSLRTLWIGYDEDPDRWYKYHTLILDEQMWEIRRSEDSEDLKTVTLPSGRRVDVESDKKISEELVPRFIKYYLGRKGTRIQELRVEDYKYPIFDIPSMNIQELYMAWLRYDLDENLLAYLKNSHFKRIAANYVNGLEDLWENLREHKITADLLLVKDEYVFGEQLEAHGIAKATHVLDRRTSEEKVEENLRGFMEDSEEKHSIGMVYRGTIRMYDDWGMNMEQVEWLEHLRYMFNAKYKYHAERNGLCLEMPGDRELFLAARKITLNRLEEEGQDNMNFRVEVLKKGTTLLYHELPAALQERYQTLNAEHIRLQVIADNRAETEREQRRAEREERRAQREQERAERRNRTSFKVRQLLQTNAVKYIQLMILFAIPFSAAIFLGVFFAFLVYATLIAMLTCCHLLCLDEDVDEDEEEEEDDDY